MVAGLGVRGYDCETVCMSLLRARDEAVAVCHRCVFVAWDVCVPCVTHHTLKHDLGVPRSAEVLVSLPHFSILPLPSRGMTTAALPWALSPCVNSGRVSWPGWA